MRFVDLIGFFITRFENQTNPQKVSGFKKNYGFRSLWMDFVWFWTSLYLSSSDNNSDDSNVKTNNNNISYNKNDRDGDSNRVHLHDHGTILDKQFLFIYT